MNASRVRQYRRFGDSGNDTTMLARRNGFHDNDTTGEWRT